MLLKNLVTIKPTKEVRFLEGAVLLEHELVALVNNRVVTPNADIFFYDNKSKLLHTQTYNQEIMSFGTINRSELLVLLPATDEWAIIDCNTFKETRGTFKFRNKSAFKARVLFFPESKRMAIYEIGDFNDKPGKFTFMSYPPDIKDAWEVPIPDSFNYTIEPLNLRNRVVVFNGKVDDKIRWTIHDLDKRETKDHSVNKPGDGNEYCLKGVNELKHGHYLLQIEAQNPELRYMVYEEENTETPLRKFKTQLSDKVYGCLGIGGWLYVLEFEVDKEGVSQSAPLRVISKDTEEIVFEDKCLISTDVEYFLGTTSDRFIVRVDATHHYPKEIKVEALRATSQRELYVHLLKEITQGKIKLDMIQHVLDAFEGDS